MSQARGQGGWRDIQQILRRHRLFQEEPAQASPQQADIGSSATLQGSNHPSFGEEATCRRETPGDKLQAAKAEAQAKASRTLIGSIIPYINVGADSLKTTPAIWQYH